MRATAAGLQHALFAGQLPLPAALLIDAFSGGLWACTLAALRHAALSILPHAACCRLGRTRHLELCGTPCMLRGEAVLALLAT